jgi:two-component system, response regulator YesN
MRVEKLIKIVIADHDEFEAKGIQWLIESSISNVKVKVTTNLIETVSVLENEQPDIFIYDMHIGSGTSLETLLKIIKINEPAIISLTMEATYETAKKAIDMGTKYLLIKPFSPQELLNQINILIREHHRKRKNAVTQSNHYLPQEVIYEELFMSESKKAEPFVFIAVKPEKSSILPVLNRFLKYYLFPVSPLIFPLSDMSICLFKDLSQANWNEICKRFMDDWDQQEKETICIIVNREQHSDLTVHDKYIHTKKMTEVAFFIGYQQVLEFEKPLQWEFIDPFLTPHEQRQWISFLMEGNKEGISTFLATEFLQFTDSYPDPGLLRIRLTSILAQIRRHMKSANLDPNRYEQGYLEIFDTILYDPLIYRIVQKLVIFTSKILDAVFDTSHNQHLDIIDKCIHYMELNYWKKDLDLSHLSSFVRRNSTYLSHLFVDKTKKTFRESLTHLRIKEAKRLLIETELAIKEISSLTGFQNQHYFSRVFKNSVGRAPKQFRMLGSIEN